MYKVGTRIPKVPPKVFTASDPASRRDKYSSVDVAGGAESPRGLENHGGFDAEKKQHKKKRGALNLIKAALLLMRGGTNRKPKCEEAQVGSQDMIKKIVGSMRPLHLQDNPSSPPPPTFRSFPSRCASLDNFHDVYPSPSSPLVRSSTYAASSDDNMSSYASFANLQDLDMGSRCPSFGNLQELASITNLQDIGSRCTSSTNLQELGANLGEAEAEAEAEAGTGGISRRCASMSNLQEMDGGYGGKKRYASTSSNLQVLDVMPEGDDEMIDVKADQFIARFYEQMSLQRSDSVARYKQRMDNALR